MKLYTYHLLLFLCALAPTHASFGSSDSDKTPHAQKDFSASTRLMEIRAKGIACIAACAAAATGVYKLARQGVQSVSEARQDSLVALRDHLKKQEFRVWYPNRWLSKALQHIPPFPSSDTGAGNGGQGCQQGPGELTQYPAGVLSEVNSILEPCRIAAERRSERFSNPQEVIAPAVAINSQSTSGFKNPGKPNYRYFNDYRLVLIRSNPRGIYVNGTIVSGNQDEEIAIIDSKNPDIRYSLRKWSDGKNKNRRRWYVMDFKEKTYAYYFTDGTYTYPLGAGIARTLKAI